jgi:carbonic anhydrase/acetyltransferase-like protein (isoleucine patch superfamily)
MAVYSRKPTILRKFMAIYQIGKLVPDIHPSAYIAESADVIGNVHIKANATVWFNTTIRADNDSITIGENSNVQDACVLHADPGYPLTLERNVSVGHQAMLHGCTIGEGSLVGIQAVILNGAKIGKNCLVGAGALVTEGKEFPDNSLILGSPAKVARTLSEEQIAGLKAIVASYVERGKSYRQELKRIE